LIPGERITAFKTGILRTALEEAGFQDLILIKQKIKDEKGFFPATAS
jgi:hypothetical protein